jgi:hypothetical protein
MPIIGATTLALAMFALMPCDLLIRSHENFI